MRKRLWLLLLLLGIGPGVQADSLDSFVYQEQAGENQAIILNGGGNYIVDFRGLDRVGFGTRFVLEYPLKIVLAKTGPRKLKIFSQDRGLGEYHYIHTELDVNPQPGRIYSVVVSNQGIHFNFMIADITDQDVKISVEQYISQRMATEQDATVIPDKFSLDAILFRLNNNTGSEKNILMTMATLAPLESAARQFARAMFENSDGNRRAGLLLTLQKDAGFWLAEYELGKMACRQGQYPEALARMEAVSRLYPEEAMAYLYQGYALFMLKKYPEATAAFARAAELKNPGAKMIMARLQTKTLDQIFEQYNRPMESEWYSLYHGSIGMAGHAESRLTPGTEYDFGVATGVDQWLLGVEIGNIGATTDDPELQKFYTEEVYEFGLYLKYLIPIEQRFLATVGAGYYMLSGNQAASADEQTNSSFRLMAGGEYFLIRNLALGLDLGYRGGEIKFKKQSYATSPWGYVTPTTTYVTVNLSGLYGQLGLKWYLW